MKTAQELVTDSLDLENTIRILEQLVSVPSAVGHEENLAELIGDVLREDGFDIEFQRVEGMRKNVVATYRFSSSGPCLMFNGHLDTVAASGNWHGDPHEPVRRDGRDP